jgi:PAS domain S-box-containing protein
MKTDLQPSQLRKTGISVIGDVRWGTHFCYFYETKQDLLDTLVLFFKAGLENNEFCLWVVTPPLTVEEATRALGQAVSDLDRRLASQDIEIQDYAEWYLHNGHFDPQRVLQGWREKLDQALAGGYAGMRASGDAAWSQKDDWSAFREYEKALDALDADKRRILLCTYPLTTSPGAQIFDVARLHQVAVARRHGRWEMLEAPELKQSKAELAGFKADLERRVAERTKELEKSNESLRSEIAERRLAEEAVKQAEDRIRLVIDTIPTMVWSLRPDGVLDFVNQRWLDYAGLSFEDAIAEPMRVMHPEDLSRVTEKWLKDMAAGEPSEDEMRLRRADGEYRWFLIRTVPLHDEEGNIVKWYGTSTDIEDRKQAETQARALVDAIPHQIWSGPPDGTLDYCNERWRSYMGLEMEDARGAGWQTMLHPDDRERVLKAWHESVANGTPYEQEERHRGADGTYRWFLSLGIPLRDAGGRIVRWYGTNTDIEDRKQAEQMLRDSREQLRALTARLESLREVEATRIAREIHDELGQKLTGLKMDLRRAERKLEEFESSPAVNSLLDTLVSATELVDGITGSVQEIAANLRPEMLDKLGLGATLNCESRRFQERTGISCEVHLPETEPNLSTEVSTALFRIFQECLTNIVRHAHATKVEAALKLEDGPAATEREHGGRVTLRVQDNGRGITEAEIANPESLGLLGMKERTALLGGEIVFHRDPKGGTIVTVRIPQGGTLVQAKEPA